MVFFLHKTTGAWYTEDNIIMDLKEIGMNTRNSVDSIPDRDYWRTLVIAVLSLRVS